MSRDRDSQLQADKNDRHLYNLIQNIGGAYKFIVYSILHPLEYDRVYLPLCKVADTPCHIQGDVFLFGGQEKTATCGIGT